MPKLNLKKLTSLLLQQSLPVACRKQNLLINDVPDSIFLGKDKALAIPVIRGLITSILSNTENACIRLSARIFDGMIFLKVSDGKENNYCGVIEGFEFAKAKSNNSLIYNYPNIAA
jgi:hypothetical protein